MVAHVITILICMQELPGSCCGWDISCSELQLLLFSSVQPNAGIVTRAITATFHSFLIYFLLLIAPLAGVCTLNHKQHHSVYCKYRYTHCQPRVLWLWRFFVKRTGFVSPTCWQTQRESSCECLFLARFEVLRAVMQEVETSGMLHHVVGRVVPDFNLCNQLSMNWEVNALDTQFPSYIFQHSQDAIIRESLH